MRLFSFRLPVFVFFIFFFVSCQQEGKTLLGYSGASGEMIIAVHPSLWNGDVGRAIQKTIGGQEYGLPQSEPHFTLINTERKNIETLFKTHRNVFIVDIDPKHKSADLKIQKSPYAKDQLAITVSAPDEASFIDKLHEQSDYIVSAFQKMEINRLVKRNKKHGNQAIMKDIEERHHLSFVLQKDMYIASEDDNFIWLRIERERPVGGYQHQISQGLLVYYYDYTDTAAFDDSLLLAVKDSITKKYIPGPTKGSYQSTSYKYIQPKSNEVDFRGNYGKELRGLWRIENGYNMGGPFYSLTTYDPERNRVVTLEGYVFCPQFDKREYLRELEAIIKSVKFSEIQN